MLQFDKNDVEELGLLKLDLLSLRTLGAVGATLDSLKHDGVSLDYSQIPSSDSSTYAMLNAPETVGVFQLESPSQRALQSVMCSTDMDDIVASIALIRPGPIRGNMVSPFIRRHLGLEEPTYTDPRLEPILGPTHGVILYQEQVLQVAMAIAGYTPGEADQLRRDMSDCRSSADMQRIVQSFTVRATAQGCTSSTAQEIADHLFAYAGYGFCQGHAEAFAATAYKTAYLIRHYPAHYLAALMSHQPLGFYPTHTLCVEAQRRGIRVLGPDINRSELGFAVGNRGKSIRTSLYQVKFIEQTAHTIIAERTRGGDFLSLPDFCHRVHPRKEQLGNLIKAGAFDCFDTNRRRMLWYMDSALQSTGEGAGLFPSEPPAPPLRRITDFSLTERVRYEQESLGYTVSAHPVQLWRGALRRRGFTQVSSLPRLTSGEPVQLAGLVVRPQRPATRSGNTIVFFSLEDESGLVDITVFERVYQRDGRHIFTLPAVEVTGHVERRGRGVSVVADALTPLSLEKRPT